MTRSHLLLALPLLFSTAAVAQAPVGGLPKRVFLQALDTDGDGMLSAAEIAGAPQSLRKLDRDGDGTLTPAEYSPRLDDKNTRTDLEERLMLLDKNGDGVLTVDEVPERMRPMFDRGDANHDGRLTREEIVAMGGRQADPQGRPVGRGNFQSMDPIVIVLDADRDGVLSAEEIANAPAALKTLDKDGDGALSAGEMEMRQQTPKQRAEHMFDEWDTNKDGKLSKAEMSERMQAQFEAIDANHDGFVDRGEATAYMEKQPVGRGAPAAGPPRQ